MGDTPNLSKLLFHYDEELRNKMDELARWEIEYIDDWSLDQEEGRLILTRNDGVKFTCPAQIVGSHRPDEGEWMWAWANPSIVDSLKIDSLKVKEYGEKNGFEKCTNATADEYEDGARQLAALAAHLSGAWGVYRGMADPSAGSWLMNAMIPNNAEEDEDEEEYEPAPTDVYILLRDIVMERPDGTQVKLEFHPDLVFFAEGEPFEDPDVARVVEDYTAAIAEWSRRCFERSDRARSGEIDRDEKKKTGVRERREIFETYCSTTCGRVMTKLTYGSDDVPEKVFRMIRYLDGTVSAITDSGRDDFSAHTVYRLVPEDGQYRIFRKYQTYSDGSRNASIGDQDL